jgi:hypothetical protein
VSYDKKLNELKANIENQYLSEKDLYKLWK